MVYVKLFFVSYFSSCPCMKICAIFFRLSNNWFSLRFAQGERGAEPVPLPSAPLRENQGHETDRFAAAQPRVRPHNGVPP
jgi:hypothetical protein